MAEKLIWTELRRALAARAGVSEKKAGAFLNAVQSQLLEALKSDKTVKINGLGTFKLQPVAPRKSVNVSTGEEIVIEGYNKLAFAPEAGVKELVEKTSIGSVPSSETPDPIKKLGAQAEEIVDLLGDLGQSPVAEPKKEKPKAAPKTAKKAPEKEPVAEPVVEPVVEPEQVVQKPQEKKKNHFVRDTLICVVILLLLLLVGYFFLRQQLSNIIDSFLQPAATEVVVTDTVAETVPVVEAEAVEQTTPEELVSEEAAPKKEVASKKKNINKIPKGNISQEQILSEFLQASEDYDDNRYPELITIEEMHQDSRLAWMAKRFYGAKIYWPYLYDANRDILDNPSMITTGTPIRVPKLSKQQLDTLNAETAARLEQLRLEAEEACKK